MAIESRASTIQTIQELQAAVDRAEDGDVIHLGAVRIRGNLVISRSITLRGSGAERTVLDGRGRGAVISVDAEDAEVRIEEMSITGGKSPSGGAISIDNGARVFVVGCLIERNAARSGRGGAICVDRGSLSLAECTLVQNAAFMGGAVFVGGDAKAEITASIVAENAAVRGGAVAVADGATLDVFTSRLEANAAELEGHHLYAYGTRSRRPMILLSNAMLGKVDSAGLAIANHLRFKADISVDNSTLGREVLQTNLVA
jgi:hypothetical protein